MDFSTIIDELENPDNELLCCVDHDQEKLNSVASLLVQASALIQNAYDIALESDDSHVIAALEDIAKLASSYDENGSSDMVKRASVLDELLHSIASDPKTLIRAKIAAAQKIKDMREKYRNAQKDLSVQKELIKKNKLDDGASRIKKSNVLDVPKINTPMAHPRDSRTCPDHAGALVARVGPGVYQCSIDGKVYDFNQGFALESGQKVMGGSVADQNAFNPGFEIPAWNKPTKI